MRRQKGLSLLSVVITLAIIGICYLVLMKTYFKNPAGIDSDTRRSLQEQGVDASNLHGVVQKAQDTADKANALIKQREQEAARSFSVTE